MGAWICAKKAQQEKFEVVVQKDREVGCGSGVSAATVDNASETVLDISHVQMKRHIDNAVIRDRSEVTKKDSRQIDG